MEQQLDYSIEFYTWCKKLISTDYKLFSRYDSDKVQNLLREVIMDYEEALLSQVEYEEYYVILHNKILESKNKKGKVSILPKLAEYERIQMHWNNEISVKLFITALQFILQKDSIFQTIKDRETEVLDMGDVHPLSLTYDNISIKKPYALRVLTIIEVDKLLEVKSVFTYKDELEEMGIEIKGAIINILIESINQSIKSDAGNSYEEKIENHLRNEVGIEEIEKITHSSTGSIEHDFKFEIEGTKYSISAKRTLRERYKQYVNLVQNIPELDIDVDDVEEIAKYQHYQDLFRQKIIEDLDANVLITVTLGTDLTENKAITLRAFGVHIFIADEIYAAKQKLRVMDGVYPVSEFTLDTLKALS